MNRTLIIAVATIMCVTAFCSPILSDNSSAEYKADEKISESGFVKTQESLLYYAKFGCGGFRCTDGSTSVDTPGSQVGELMHANSVYVKLTGLDSSKSYKLSVSEYASESSKNALASFTVDLDLKSTGAFVWYSVSESTNKVYAAGDTAATSGGETTPANIYTCKNVSFNGTFTNTISSQIFKIDLMDADGDSLSEDKITDIAHYSRIVMVDSINFDETYGETDLISAKGKEYGFTKVDPAYAGNSFSCGGFNKYVWAVFITNVDNPVIKIQNGGTYTLAASDIKLNTDALNNPLTNGYGCLFVDADTLANAGIDNIDYFKITIGDNSDTYADAEFGASEGGTNNKILYGGIAIGVIAIAAIAAAVLIKRRS